MTRVIMTVLVRNNEDVLDAHLSYHLTQGVAFFVVTDNGSDDRSREILDRYARRGVAHVISEPTDNYAQARWVTRMARLAATEFGADWVMHADVDEFFLARYGRLDETLASVPEAFGIVTIPRLNFRPAPDTGQPFYERMIVREARAVNALGDPLPPKICHRASPEARVAMGNHDVEIGRLRRLGVQPIQIFHYPMRSYPEFEAKIRLGAHAIARNRDLGLDAASTWRRLSVLRAVGRLPQYFDSQVVTGDTLATGLRNGAFVVDRRLAHRLANVARDPVASTPERPYSDWERLYDLWSAPPESGGSAKRAKRAWRSSQPSSLIAALSLLSAWDAIRPRRVSETLTRLLRRWAARTS